MDFAIVLMEGASMIALQRSGCYTIPEPLVGPRTRVFAVVGPRTRAFALGDSMHDLDELFRKHGAMVYRRALRVLGDRADAEEATQEVFLRVMRGGFEGRSKVTSWLYRVTTNYCLNLIRDRSRRRELMDEHGPALVERDEGPCAAELATLRRLLSQADAKQAQAAVYVYMDGMSYREAAELLGVSKRTVGNLVARFQEWARAELERPSGSAARRGGSA